MLPVFLDVTSEVSVDKAPCVMELTSVRVFLLEPTLPAMAGNPIVVLDDDEFTDRDGFASFAGGSTLALDIPESMVLNASVTLDPKLMVSATVSLFNVELFWTTIPISISGMGFVDAAGGPCWLDWSFCAVSRDGCRVSPACTRAGGGLLGTTIVFPCLTSLSDFDDGLELVLVLLPWASDMAENDILMSPSIVPVSAMFFIRAVIDRSEESSS